MDRAAIFDPRARRARRDRAARGENPLDAHIAEGLIERIDSVRRSFAHALVINSGSGVLARALEARGLSVATSDVGARYAGAGLHRDEVAPWPDAGSYDLIVAPCGFDTVDDLPGALVLAQRALAPDGLFLATMPAAPGLPTLRSAVAVADAEQGRAVARLHPQIDVRAGGDLLARAGFVLPVADAETLSLGYRDLDALLRDVTACGGRNVLATRYPVTGRWLEVARRAFAAQADEDGRVVETVTLMTLTGWRPV